MAFVEPLPPETTPELAETFDHFREILGFVPNSLLTMQRRPAIVKAFGELTEAVMDPGGSVDPAFKRLLAHFASRAAGCQYCEAHSLIAAGISGVARTSSMRSGNTAPATSTATPSAPRWILRWPPAACPTAWTRTSWAS